MALHPLDYDSLHYIADDELRGEITRAEAVAEVERFVAFDGAPYTREDINALQSAYEMIVGEKLAKTGGQS